MSYAVIILFFAIVVFFVCKGILFINNVLNLVLRADESGPHID